MKGMERSNTMWVMGIRKEIEDSIWLDSSGSGIPREHFDSGICDVKRLPKVLPAGPDKDETSLLNAQRYSWYSYHHVYNYFAAISSIEQQEAQVPPSPNEMAIFHLSRTTEWNVRCSFQAHISLLLSVTIMILPLSRTYDYPSIP